MRLILSCLGAAAFLSCASDSEAQGPRAYWEPGVGPVVDDSATVSLGSELASAGARRVASAELECPVDEVRVVDYGDHIQASGCSRIVYFVKRTASNWERAGPVFDLEPEDVPPADLRLTEVTQPVRTGGALAKLEREDLDDLRSWSSQTMVHCILRADGTLRHCIVVSDEERAAQAVTRVLGTWRYAPATAEGRPVPVPVTIRYRFRVPRPQCANLGSSMERLRCQRMVEQLDSAERR